MKILAVICLAIVACGDNLHDATLNEVALGAFPFYAAFVARFRTDDGGFLWARKIDSDNGGDAGKTVAATSDGGAIVTSGDTFDQASYCALA